MAATVADVMTANPAAVEADEPVTRPTRIMRERDAGAVIVNDHDRFAGIITDRDITIRVVSEDRDPRQTTTREAASLDVETVTPSTPVDDAAELMRLRAVRRLPVVEGDHAVGILSLGDLAVEGDTESVLGQVSAMPGNR